MKTKPDRNNESHEFTYRKTFGRVGTGIYKRCCRHKSVTLKQRQKGNNPEVIVYADKANERLRRKFYRMTLKNNTKRNVATTTIAKELTAVTK